MNETPLLSIIVPVYNTLPYLPKCLDTLLGQTLRRIEIVCIDDGSTDGSSELLDSYAEKDDRLVVLHQANAGVSAARNKGLDHARGTFVLFVDSDDYIERYACEKLVNVAERDNADIVIFGGETFPSDAWLDDNMSTIDATYHGGGLETLFYAQGAFPLMCNKLYRHSLIKNAKLRFNTKLKLGEDHAFQFCIFPEAQIVTTVRDHIYHYRYGHEGSALSSSQSDVYGRAKQHLSMVTYVLEYWNEKGILHERPYELGSWFTDFLLSSVWELPLKQRVEFGRAYQQMVDRFGLESDILLSPIAASRHRCLTVGDDMEPRISAIVLGGSKKCVMSLLKQELPQVEVISVCDHSAELDDDFADDPRPRRAGSLSEALASARAELVLVAAFDDTYQPFSLRAMAESALVDNEVACDVVTIQDRAATLRVHNLTTHIRSLSNDGTQREITSMHSLLSPDELPASPVEVFSLDRANKLWRVDFARTYLTDVAGPYEVGQALLAATVFVPISEPYFEKSILTETDPSVMRDLGHTQVEALAKLKEDGLEQQTVSRTAIALCLGIAERTANTAAATAYLDTFVSEAYDTGSTTTTHGCPRATTTSRQSTPSIPKVR